MEELQQIIPRLPRPGEIRPDSPYKTPEERWQKVTEEIYGSSGLPGNIRFEHNPYWRKGIFSIQRAHDQSHWLWLAAFYLLMFSDLAWFFTRIVR